MFNHRFQTIYFKYDNFCPILRDSSMVFLKMLNILKSTVYHPAWYNIQCVLSSNMVLLEMLNLLISGSSGSTPVPDVSYCVLQIISE